MPEPDFAVKTRPRRLCELVCLGVVVLSATGCGGQMTGRDATATGSGPMLRIDLEGLQYLSTGKRVVQLDSVSGGLANLGDIDGDGSDDILVASNSRRPGQPIGWGWIEAYSGVSGKRLWQVSGMNTEQARAAGFQKAVYFNDAYIVTDVDGDQVPDVYAIEDYSKRDALWISGKSGQIIGMWPIEGRDWWRRPAGIRTAAGKLLQLVFPVNRLSENPLKPAFEFAEARRLEKLGQQAVQWGSPPLRELALLTTGFPDQNGDGICEWLFRKGMQQDYRDPVYQWSMGIICGSEFKLIREFQTDRPRVTGAEFWCVAMDLPVPGASALVMSTNTGEGPQNRASSLRVVALDGQVIWKVAGTDLEGGTESFTVDRAGKKSESMRDAEFGKQAAISAGDVNSDGITDIATIIQQPTGRAIAIFSGANGTLIRRLGTGRKELRISQTSPLIRIDQGRRSALVSACTNTTSGHLELWVVSLEVDNPG